MQDNLIFEHKTCLFSLVFFLVPKATSQQILDLLCIDAVRRLYGHIPRILYILIIRIHRIGFSNHYTHTHTHTHTHIQLYLLFISEWETHFQRSLKQNPPVEDKITTFSTENTFH